MIDLHKIKHELEKLHAFLHGAHNATSQEEASSTFHQACHKIDDILKELEK
jgi:hypothetical protein